MTRILEILVENLISWPAVGIILVVLFRKEASQLSKVLEKIEMGGASFYFYNRLNAVSNQLEQAKTASNDVDANALGIPGAQDVSEAKERLVELSRIPTVDGNTNRTGKLIRRSADGKISETKFQLSEAAQQMISLGDELESGKVPFSASAAISYTSLANAISNSLENEINENKQPIALHR